jgi:undecaprenyl diphosphate synthase
LIRTGGESRISNFLLWQTAYTELYFTDVYWPDFDAAALKKATQWFEHRVRRFGRTDDQVAANPESPATPGLGTTPLSPPHFNIS